jgi:hypothetical protein
MGEKMKTIRKVACMSMLGVSALMLTACGDDNPMLDPQTLKDVTTVISHHLSTEDLVSCAEYGVYPDKFEYRELVCSRWMNDQYNEYLARKSFQTRFLGANDASNSKSPTLEQFTDPEAWAIIWDKNGKKWQAQLIDEKETERKQEEQRKKDAIKRAQWEKEQEIKRVQWEKEVAERQKQREIEHQKLRDRLCKRFPNGGYCDKPKSST